VNTDTVTKVVAALAENDGLLSVRTANEKGIGRVTLKRAADEGFIAHVGRGRYALLDAVPRELALKGVHLGRDGVLSHRGGTYFWGMDGVDEMILEWSIPHSGRNTTELVHRRRRFDDLEVVERGGIYVTSVAQTLADLGAVCDADIVERAVESALRKQLVTEDHLRAFAISRARSRHGGPTLRAVLDRRRRGELPTGSDIETICLQVYRRAGLVAHRQWEVRDAGGVLLGRGDFGFPPKAFISEVDGLESHDLSARQHDYNRQAAIENLGYSFRRFTREDVLWRPKHVCDVTRRGIALARYL
jgi:hypothetical protein